MADFDHTTIEEEIVMLTSMIAELDDQLEQTKQGRIKLINILRLERNWTLKTKIS